MKWNQPTTWRIAGCIIMLLVAVVLSHLIEPTVHVEHATIGANTPALHFTPNSTGKHPVALLGHGVTASKETLFRIAEALTAADFECYAIDFPGHGESSSPFRPRELVPKLKQIAQAIEPIDVYIGHSMGAYVGGTATHDTNFAPRLFIAIGAIPPFGKTFTNHLILNGTFDELFLGRRHAKNNPHLELIPWCDHGSEIFDPRLVRRVVEASCAAVGKTPPQNEPTQWMWRSVGLSLGIASAFMLLLSLPRSQENSLRTKWHGVIYAVIYLTAVALTSQTWISAAPHLARIPAYIVVIGLSLLVIPHVQIRRLKRWTFPAITVVAIIANVVFGLYFSAFMAALFLSLLVFAAVIGALAARTGTTRDGDIAMAIIVGYAVAQSFPKLL
jgi:hypothetical protein